MDQEFMEEGQNPASRKPMTEGLGHTLLRLQFPTLNAFTAIYPSNFKDLGRYHSLNRKEIKKTIFL